MTTTQFSSEAHSQYKAKAYAAASAKSPLAPMIIPRRDPGEHDVQIANRNSFLRYMPLLEYSAL
jgi:hypothetical protein